MLYRIFSCCTLVAALGLIVPATAAANTGHKSATKSSISKTSNHSAKAKPSAKNKSAKAKTSKPAAKTSKTAKSSNKQITNRAIANARKDVTISRTLAMSTTLDNPGVQSTGVLVLNEQSGEIMFEKNADAVTPIASITKLMTAMVTLDAQLPLNELLTISQADVDTLKNTTSRLTVGTTLTRGELLLLALMASENRAAAALARTFPSGQATFIRKMNEKAQSLGMRTSRFYDSTGLTPSNVSTPRELALMVKAAHHYPEIHDFTTSSEYSFISSQTGRNLAFHNTNPLVKAEDWTIGVSKTGFINEAGRCLVMQATIDGTPVVIVLLDSNGKYTRIGDAQRVRKWIETTSASKLRAG
ncbi:D-alanyl-D-alanine endopeptidase [Iodobacter fluviatilis]|jgi:D-alanyl-D-alanine endopeptidase (penicillin-binding protein 7)|uniref:D-alanyl-D-alanine endopeptidase n=1 Tax=Iodobacter fluviatilis TaxID=537 RepID=A0A7G3GAJ5_9NEIS|nr:D-alanyl-D-alanine endopeptidase [Iodobacter fluviatilis]QBC44266.1 D-alanyl-D-alanine endopeptidase [Iodobacter fluviatilis]